MSAGTDNASVSSALDDKFALKKAATIRMQAPGHLAKSCLEWDLCIGVELEAFDGKTTYYFQRPASEPRFVFKRERVHDKRTRKVKVWTQVQRVRCVGYSGNEDSLRIMGKTMSYEEFNRRYIKDEYPIQVIPYLSKDEDPETKEQNMRKLKETTFARVLKYYENTYMVPPKQPEIQLEGRSWADMCEEAEAQ